MKTLVAAILLCLAAAANAVSIDLTSSQVTVVCNSQGGCGAGTSPPPTCSPGSHLEGNVCVPDPPPPGGGWDGTTCSGYDHTIVLTFPWISPVRQYSGRMGVNDIIVARFTTGNVSSANNNLPRIAGAEWGSPPSGRSAVLSATPCDFSTQTWAGAVTAGNSVQVPFAIGTGSNFGYYPILAKNTTYYFNIKNVANQSCSAQGICDMFVELLLPSGL